MTASGSLVLSAEAGATVGTVLLEAIALYASYGALERVVGPTMVEALT